MRFVALRAFSCNSGCSQLVVASLNPGPAGENPMLLAWPKQAHFEVCYHSLGHCQHFHHPLRIQGLVLACPEAGRFCNLFSL